MAFSWDRICKACDTRYTPPTPVWAAILFILGGLPLATFGVVGVVLHLAGGTVLSLLALAVESSLGVLGLAAIIHGVRSLALSGNV
jgi:hypothetical protein